MEFNYSERRAWTWPYTAVEKNNTLLFCPCTFVFVVLGQDSLNWPAAALEYSRRGFRATE